MQDKGTDESIVMEESEIDRTLVRMAHQILEQNKGCQDLAIVGIVTRGDVLARRIARLIEDIEGTKLPVGSLDISFYRDDSIMNLSPVLHKVLKSFFLSTVKQLFWLMMFCIPVALFERHSML